MTGTTGPPLAGVRILDLSWVMVGPFSVRSLQRLGADVIKVESSGRIDPLRTLPPFPGGRPDPDRSLSYHFINGGKRAVDLDLRSPEGRDVALRLAEQADVVIESFTPGVVERLGLGYAELSARKRDIVMVSTNVAGRAESGTQRSGVGTLGAAMSGVLSLVGYPDEPPYGPYGPWTDAIAPRFIVPAVLAALRRRDRTGEGCYVEVSQAEAGMQFILPALLDYQVNGVVARSTGAAPDPLRAPCAFYPCTGTDRWVAVDAAPGAQWTALREVVGEGLAAPEFRTLIGRLRHREQLDAALADWTRTRSAQEVETALQEVGVPAHVVSGPTDLQADPHLHAGWYGTVSDERWGEVQMPGLPYDLERSGLRPVRRGPFVGEHTAEVLAELEGPGG
jgi:benzylsuccinate CoA-transferase BbsF subunit